MYWERYRFVLTVLLCAFTYVAVNAEQPSNIELQANLEQAIQFLASDEMRGRTVGSEEIELAATYIRGQFAEVGLDVQQYGGTGMQPVQISLESQAGDPEKNFAGFQVTGDNEKSIRVAVGSGMNPMTIGAQAGNVEGKVVFAGYGITAPALKYDDYKGIDVTDAIVIVIRKEPGADDPKSPFNGRQNTRHAFFATKIENAIKHGAAAVIIVNDPASAKGNLQTWNRRIQQELDRKKKIEASLQSLPPEAKNSRATFEKKLAGIQQQVKSLEASREEASRGVLGVGEAGGQTNRRKVVPVLSIGRDVFDDLLVSSSGMTLASVEESIDQNYQPKSMILDGVAGSISVELRRNETTGKNVLGVLPGKGELQHETVIVGAHYDHVGMGEFGSLAPGTIAVHNGADDNASGTAVMIESARQIAESLKDEASHRRVLFIAFTAEERGLLGSKFYVDHPLFSIDKTAAMINLDMVGRARDNELTIYGTGSAEEFDAFVDRLNQDAEFDLTKVQSGYGPSDHQSFYTKGIPVLFFFTGLHDDYHRPGDDIEKLNFPGMVRITRMVSTAAKRIAVQATKPTYAKTDKKVNINRQRTAHLGVTLSEQGDSVLLSSVTPDGPAAKAGLLKGDRINKLVNKQVKSTDDVLEFLRSVSPGQSLMVQIVRDGNAKEVKVTLGKRP